MSDETLRPRPQLGLGAAWIGDEEEALVLDVLRRKELFRYYGNDAKNPPPMATTLETEFAARVGATFALAVTSGTAALECALAAVGVGPGDSVIVPAWSWISCFTAVVRLGAVPILAEVDGSFCLAPGEIARLRRPDTKAAIVVHYQGVAGRLNELLAECETCGVTLVEDCAESPGATYFGRNVGTLARVGSFSFQYNKSVTCGEGGMVVTDDPALYERAVRMHDLGLVRAPHLAALGGQTTQTPFCGTNFRMTELQAAVALAQFRKLDAIVAHCKRLKSIVMGHACGLDGLCERPLADPAGDQAFELYFHLPTPEIADAFRGELTARNVHAGKVTGTYCHYARPYCQPHCTTNPDAVVLPEPWPAPGYRAEDFPRTEAIVQRHLAIPLGVLFTDEDADYIGRSIVAVHAKRMGGAA